jgi:hypothetical protein
MNRKLISILTILILSSSFSIAQNYSQSVRDFVEGKFYKNSETGRSIKYGYISSLNTYGVTFKDAEGNLNNFMNCTEQLSSDEQYMELTFCMSPNTGGTLGKIGVYKTKIVLYSSDGFLTFNIDESNENQSQNNNTKSVKELLADVYKINNLEVAKFDYKMEGLTIDEANLECAKLGKGWRLPTKSELILMYENKDKVNLEKATTNLLYYVGVDNNQLVHVSMISGAITPLFGTISKNDKVKAVKSM